MNINFKRMELLAWYRKSKEAGRGKIYLRITIDNKRAEFSTDIEVTHSDFDRGKFMPTPTGLTARYKVEAIKKTAKEINEQLFRLKIGSTAQYVLKVLAHLRRQGEGRFFSPIYVDDIQEAFATPKIEPIIVKEPTVIEILTFYRSKQKVGETRTRCYMAYERNIRQYLIESGKADLSACNFTFAENLRFQEWANQRNEWGQVYIESHISHLKAAMGTAIDWELIEKNPLQRFEKSAKCKKSNVHLKIGHLQILRQLDMTGQDPKLIRTRDIFLFMSYTGMHYIDTMRLTHEHIKFEKEGDGDFDKVGRVWLKTIRKKTGVEVSQIMHPEAIRILNKYDGRPQNLTHQAGELIHKSTAAMTYWLDKLGKLLGYPIKWTTKVPRKSFTNISLNTYIHDPLSTARMMGLKDIKTLAYYGEADDDRLKEVTKW